MDDDQKMSGILEIWKSKSLNSMPTEKYTIALNSVHKPTDIIPKHSKKGAQPKLPTEPKQERMPEPKITKISESTFCVNLMNGLTVYKFPTPEERQVHKNLKKTFREFAFTFSDVIKFVVGNNSQTIFVGLENELHIIGFTYEVGKTDDGKQVKTTKSIYQVDMKHIAGLKNVGFIKELKAQSQVSVLVAVSKDKIYKYSMDDSFKLIQELKIALSKPQMQEVFASTQSISLLSQNNSTMFMLSTKQGTRQEMNEKYEGNVRERKCEYLYLTKFMLEQATGDTVLGYFQMIDSVFEIGIFGRSKTFLVGPSVFLISLFEEIIIVKYNFEKYVVWDNVSLAPTKSNEKKGQLVLADKIVMVYTEMGEIYAHNIFFSSQKAKLKYPRIDNFKGNDNDEEILYDAIVLEYEAGSFMKVLFYFKEIDVYSPNNPMPMYKDEKMTGDGKSQSSLNFNILCIQQNKPELKLGELFRNKKTPQEINQFVKRFNIPELTKSKCEWSVSDKTEKDIENLLLQIKDNEYIQEELTKILKDNPHDLKFLLMIENKQIQRYKKMLATKLLKLDEPGSQQVIKGEEDTNYFTNEEKSYIKDIIKWVMEAIMFKKKLAYSKNFLEFKEYNFIEIGKLKAASLKEEVKLLSCKGYEKRLQFFLNSFKYMALANFEDIFTFLIDDKNEEEVQAFFIEHFSFILPKFEEPSAIFLKKQAPNKVTDYRSRRFSFSFPVFQAAIKQIVRQETDCKLWVDRFDESEIETKESFYNLIQKQIQEEKKKDDARLGLKQTEAEQCFKHILNEFVSEQWFLKNKSKQHSIIHINIEELKKQFYYLKRIGVFNIMIKLFYSKISKKIYKQEKVLQVLEVFTEQRCIPRSFKCNIQARTQVYAILPKRINLDPPLRENFLIMEETDYFQYLFQNFRQMLLKDIKKIYNAIEEGFFREKFEVYLKSDTIVLDQIINFLDEFEENEDDDIRMDVFTCVKDILKVNDRQNTGSFVNKLMNKQILKNENNQTSISALIDEAKVCFGYYFFNFFYVFRLNYTYKELIDYTAESEFERNKFIEEILQKYCTQDYIMTKINSDGEEVEFQIKLDELYGLEAVEGININGNPLDFFGMLLYATNTLKFQIEPITIFQKFIELLLESENCEENCEKDEKNQEQDYIEEEHQFLHTIIVFIDDYRHHMSENQSKDGFGPYNEYIYQKQLEDFYETYDITEKLIECILSWARRKYMEVIPKSYTLPTHTYKSLFAKITMAYEVLDKLEIQHNEINREKSFLSMVERVMKVFPSLVSYIILKRFNQSSLQNSVTQHSEMLSEVSSFDFMIDILGQIPIDKFSVSDDSTINGNIYQIELIYDDFKNASKFAEDDEHGFKRFMMELIVKLIEYDKFPFAFQVLLRTINTEYYFRDIFFHFMSCVRFNPGEDLKRFIKSFIQAKSKHQMTNKIKQFFLENEIHSFEKQPRALAKSSSLVFSSIIESFQIDEAFYFLIRNNNLKVSQKDYERQKFSSYELIARYTKCLKNYLCLNFYPTFSFYKKKQAMLTNEFERKDIIKDINIAISRIREKLGELKLIIKQKQKLSKDDIRLSERFKQSVQQLGLEVKAEEQKEKNRQMEENKSLIAELRAEIDSTELQVKELENTYVFFMESNGLDPNVKLNKQELKSGKDKLENINRHISANQLQSCQFPEIMNIFNAKNNQDNDNDSEKKRKLIAEDLSEKQAPRGDNELENQKRKMKEKETSRFEQMERKVNEQMKQASKVSEKYEQYQADKSHLGFPNSEHRKKYEELAQKQKHELLSVKDSYKSQTSQRVSKLLQQIKIRKSRLYEKSEVESKFSQISVEESERTRKNSMDPVLEKEMPTQMNRKMEESGIKQSRKYAIEVHEVKSKFMPITFQQLSKTASNRNNEDENSTSQYLLNLKGRKMGQNSNYHSSASTAKKLSQQEITKLFEQKEPQCKKYIEKLELVKNNFEVGVQITKNIYDSIHNFDVFIKYLEYLFNKNPKYKEVLEEKAYKIASQTLGIQSKINLKDLFPIQFFTHVTDVAMKQYYKVAYETIKPRLRKIMNRSDVNVHGLAILFRYGFGSENTYYYLVYEDYIRVLVKNYSTAQVEDGQLFFLAEKLRTLYSNINPENRQNKFSELLREVSPESKKRNLIAEMIKIIDRRNEMLTGQKSSDLREVLAKLI